MLYLTPRPVTTMNIILKNNVLSNKCIRAIENSRPARTSHYDCTESRDTASS